MINLANFISSARSLPLCISHDDGSRAGIGILNFECAVRHPESNSDAITDVETAKTICFF